MLTAQSLTKERSGPWFTTLRKLPRWRITVTMAKALEVSDATTVLEVIEEVPEVEQGEHSGHSRKSLNITSQSK